MGRVNNQNFVAIPHSTFIDMLAYKAKLAGIKVVIMDEAYTSKCSFLDLEPIRKHAVYCGTQVTHGEFIAAQGPAFTPTSMPRIISCENHSHRLSPILDVVVRPVRVQPARRPKSRELYLGFLPLHCLTGFETLQNQ